MSQNKYDAIIVRTPEEGLTRDQYLIVLESMKNEHMSILDLASIPHPGTETFCVLFATEELLSHFDYHVATFVKQYTSIIDNLEHDYEGSLAIDDTEYLIAVQ